MVSTTSGTTNFTLDVDDIIEQALEPLGGEHQSGISAAKARRVLNLLLIQIQNKGITLNKLAFMDQVLAVDTRTYVLDASISDVLKISINKDSIDLPIQRYGLEQYQMIPKKDQTSARPNLFTTQRLNSTVTAIFWPVPDNNNCTAKMLVKKRIEDVDASYQQIDINARYLPLIVKWLSYELSLNKAGISEDIKNRLKSEVHEMLPDTMEEDRERADFTVKPGGISGR